MEARQFFTRSLSPLVSRTFAVTWSEDGKLAFVTKEGVHVLEMIPAPGQAVPILNLHRSFIHSPGTLPCERYGEDIVNRIFDWDKENVYSFLMTDAYTPTFPRATKPTAEICDAYWSPRDLLHPHGCLLCLLTSGGGLELAVQIDRSWFSIGNVSEAWAEFIEPDYQAIKADDDELEPQVLKNQLDRLFATSATWSCTYQDEKGACFAYLVTAHRNSELVVWQVERVMSETLRERLDARLEVRFHKKLESRNAKISSLLWISLSDKHCLVIVGYFDGPVGVLKLLKTKQELKFDSYSTCFSEVDLVPVDSIHVLRETDKWLELVVTKGMHLGTLVIDIHGKVISMKFVTSPGFSITGTTIINSDMILITTQDGQFCEVKKSYDQQELICRPIKIEMVGSPLQYLGLACSPNRVLFVLVTSPSVMYDHLIDREPSSVFFFSLSPKVLPSSNPLAIVYSKEQSLRKCWDCLELIKVNALRYDEPPSNLSKLMSHGHLDSMSAHELRAALWIMTIAEVMYKKSNSKEELSKAGEIIAQSRSYLFLHSACDYLDLLDSVRPDLTDNQKLAASLIRTHLDIWLAGEDLEDEEQEGEESNERTESPLMQRVRRSLEAFEADSFEPEKCNFCAELVLEPWSQACPTGHKLPRCAITCLQVTCARYRSCLVCDEIFHPCLDEEKLVTEIRCPYCDLPASFKNEVVDEALKASPKNLSSKLIVESKDAKADKNDAATAVPPDAAAVPIADATAEPAAATDDKMETT